MVVLTGEIGGCQGGVQFNLVVGLSVYDFSRGHLLLDLLLAGFDYFPQGGDGLRSGRMVLAGEDGGDPGIGHYRGFERGAFGDFLFLVDQVILLANPQGGGGFAGLAAVIGQADRTARTRHHITIHTRDRVIRQLGQRRVAGGPEF